MKYKLIYSLALALVLSFVKSYAQDKIQSSTQDSIQFVGGLNRYNDSPPEQLESASLQVWYEFEREVINNKMTSIITDTMVLVVGNNYSIYYDWSRETKYERMVGQLDAAKKTTRNITTSSFEQFLELAVDNEQLSQFAMNRENSEILKNRSQQVIITTDLSDVNIQNEELFLLEENIPSQEWEIHDETREVIGYTCQRATCSFRGRDYNAWFSIEIPVNDGPYKFYGLPGLILLIEDTKGEVVFRAIGLEKLENVIITSDNKKGYIKCTLEQYKTIKKRIQQTSFSYYNNPARETLHMTKVTLSIEDTPIEVILD